MSPEELAKIERAKKNLKNHFNKFFYYHSIKKSQAFFLKWHAKVEVERAIEAKFKMIKSRMDKGKSFRTKLYDEKNS
jgi:hypothetical protein